MRTPEQQSVYSKEWRNRPENRDRMKEYNREQQKRYRATDIGKARLKDKEWARKKRAMPGVAKERAAKGRIYTIEKYGITVAQYNALLESQSGGCAICGRPPTGRRLDIDHEHQKNEKKVILDLIKLKIRGLLCHRCNRALGLLSNDTANLLINANRLVLFCANYISGKTLCIINQHSTQKICIVCELNIPRDNSSLCEECWKNAVKQYTKE